MAEFHCRLADSNGKIFSETYNSATEGELRHRLSEQGYYIYSIRGRGKFFQLGKRTGRRSIHPTEFVVFNQQFAALIRAGLPILKSLELLSQLVANPQFRDILSDIATRVKSGALLSEAFEAQGFFPKVYTASLYAGEKSGSLEEVIRRFIDFQKAINATRSKIRSALTYPAIVFTLLVTLVSFLIIKVVPEYAKFYSTMGRKLPTATQLLISFSDLVRHQLLVGLIVLMVVFFGIRVWAARPKGKLWLDGLKFRLPIIGSIWIKFAFAQLSRTLSILLSGGIPLIYSLEVVADSTGNQKITGAIKGAISMVREGQSLSRSLETSEFVPALAIEMIQVGESTGSLSEMLRHVADFYDEEVATRLSQVFTYIEPVMLILLACIVTFVLVSLYLPIFQLSSMVGS
jgi:type IV pilus assembly protein PilC